MSYADKVLSCRDCGQAFTFTAGEQEFHASKGFENEPSRCPECRAARKAARGEGGASLEKLTSIAAGHGLAPGEYRITLICSYVG